MSDSIAIKLLQGYFSNLVFSYIMYARGLDLSEDAKAGGEINEAQQSIAITLLINLFSALGYTFSRAEILREVKRRLNSRDSEVTEEAKAGIIDIKEGRYRLVETREGLAQMEKDVLDRVRAQIAIDPGNKEFESKE